MSWKILHTFSPHPTLSISPGSQVELQPFWLAFMFESTSLLFLGGAKVFEIPGLPDDQEFMSLSSGVSLYLEKTVSKCRVWEQYHF